MHLRLLLFLEIGWLTTSILFKTSQKSMRNAVNCIEFDVPVPDCPIFTQAEIDAELLSNSSLTADEVQAVTNNNMQTKQGDRKFNSDGTYKILTEQLLLYSMYLSQIPPYVFKHSIYVKRYVSFASLKHSRTLLQCYCCNPQLHFSTRCMLQPIANVPTDANTDGRQYFYQMTSKPHGISIIINNANFKISLKSRSGSDIDKHNLHNLFSYLGFDTRCYENKTHTEMRQILNNVAGMDHDKYDCLMVAILTHGDNGDVLYGITGEITIQEVIETFSSKRCPTLIGKPKIFIIQACRGRRYNQAVELDDRNDEQCDMIDSGATVHPNISDYLVAYSTIPGHVSFRNAKNGSVFIHNLVKVFRKHATNEDVITMLERVSNEVTKYEPQGGGLQVSRQSPELRSALRGKVYFQIDSK